MNPRHGFRGVCREDNERGTPVTLAIRSDVADPPGLTRD